MNTVKNTPTFQFDDIAGELPEGSVPKNVDFTTASQLALELMNNFQRHHLTNNIVWRDFLSFTDTFRTFYSVETVFNTFQRLGTEKKASNFNLSDTEPRVVIVDKSSWLDIDVNFSIQDGKLVGQCAGVVSVLQNSAREWKIWMLRTWLENYQGHGHPDHLDPVDQSVSTGNENQVYDVIIAGGGQGGLGVAGRSKALGVSSILFDNRPEIGDSWAHRYDSLRWHTIKQYGNLPFGRTFSEEDDIYVPAKRIADGYKAWSERYGINLQTGTQVDSAKWDEISQTWTVHTVGTLGNEEWKSKNLILTIGPGHKSPVSPEWATPEKIEASGFKGKILHASKYNNPNDFAGKRGVVVGTANTAHDVAEDMANIGMDTTMVQRNPTFILPGEWLKESQSHDYNLDKPTSQADREKITQPYKIQREMANRVIWGLIKEYPDRFNNLEKAGFKIDRYGDIFSHLFIRFGGHYVDVGNCARIVKGEVKVKNGEVKRLTEDGMEFEDGSVLGADLIVLCTGFEHDFRKDAEEIVGGKIAAQMEDFWGLDGEGELRGYAKLAGHPALFYHGGETRLSRFYSRFVALQLQKQKLGESLQPYLEGK